MEAALVHIRIELIIQIGKTDIIFQPLSIFPCCFIIVYKCLIHHFRSQGRRNKIIDTLEEPESYIIIRCKLENLLMHLHGIFLFGELGAVSTVLDHYGCNIIGTVSKQSGGAPSPLGCSGYIDAVSVHCKFT